MGALIWGFLKLLFSKWHIWDDSLVVKGQVCTTEAPKWEATDGGYADKSVAGTAIRGRNGRWSRWLVKFI